MKETTNCIHTILLLLILPFLAGCSKNFSPQLKEADKVLFTDCKRGEAMLDSIRKAEPNMTTADLQYYKLLKLKADDKAYRPIDKKKEYIDSLVTYFQNAGDDNLLAEAYFYAGRVYFEIGDKPEALKFFQKAGEKVSEDNYAQQGDIYCQMANIYSYDDLYKEAIDVLHLAWKADSLSQISRNMLYDLRDIGEAHLSIQNIDSAEYYFNTGFKYAEIQKDSFMLIRFHHKLATTYAERKDYQHALPHINKCLNDLRFIQDVDDKSSILFTALTIYNSLGDNSLLNKYQKIILDSCNIFTKKYVLENILANNIKQAGNPQTDSIFHTYKLYSDSIMKLNNAEAVKKAEKSYNYELKEKENASLHTSNYVKSVFIFLSSATFLLIALFYHMKIKGLKQKQKILKLKLEKYKELKEKAETKAPKKIEAEIKTIKNSSIYHTLEKEMKEDTFKLTKEDWGNLQQLINEVYHDFDKNLYSILDVSSQEYKICMLIKIGISPSNIAKFMNLTKEAISASRRRMYTKTFNRKGKPADWDNIISSL